MKQCIERASLLLSLLCLLPSPSLPLEVSLPSPSSSFPPSTLTILPGSSVSSLLSSYCQFASAEDCVNHSDLISFRINAPSVYTPSLPTATLEDYTSLRHDVLSFLQSRYGYKSYLEIGCDTDQTFSKFRDAFPEGAACVDPSSGGTHRMTSDSYFADLPTWSSSFDLVFVDGLHDARQVASDVFNAFRHLRRGGTIVLHDLNPRLEQRGWGPEELASRESELGDGGRKSLLAWNGDCWKFAAQLRLMEGVEIVVVDVDHGVGVVRRRENRNRMRPELERDVATRGLGGMGWEMLERERGELLRFVTMDGLRRWLDEEDGGGAGGVGMKKLEL